MTNPFKPISRVNLHSEVMQQIPAAIQSGQWKPGSKLPGEIALAEMFQVSRTCIREVLKALAYSGVVESRSGVGTFVKEIPSDAPSPAVDLLSSTDYTQILEMRKLLEGQAAYWATERATPEEIAELESILKQEGLSLKGNRHARLHEFRQIDLAAILLRQKDGALRVQQPERLHQARKNLLNLI